MQSKEAEEQMGGYGKAEGKLDFAAGFSPGRTSVGEMENKVWRAEPGLEVGTFSGRVLNRKGHQGSNRRRASPALHVNEHRVNKE